MSKVCGTVSNESLGFKGLRGRAELEQHNQIVKLASKLAKSCHASEKLNHVKTIDAPPGRRFEFSRKGNQSEPVKLSQRGG